MTIASPRSIVLAGVLAGSLVLVTGCQSGGSGPASAASAAAVLASAAAVLPSSAGPVPTATGSASPGPSGQAASGVTGSAATGSGSNAPAGSGTAAQYNPCTKLTIADVQPFFTVPVVTALPSPGDDAETSGCEWSGNDGNGGLATSMDIVVYTGDTAATRWSLETQLGAGAKVSGVGDEAYHAAGAPDLFARFGNGPSLKVCGLTTVGATHLAGKNKYPVGAIPDSADSTIAEQFGTLCNKIFRQGTTAATMTAPAPTGAVTSSPGPAVVVPAAGGTVPGTKVPTPVGLDCSGSHTAIDTTHETVCTATTTTPAAIYPFYLKALPAAGYTINHEQEQSSNGKEIASIGFSGPDIGIFSIINVAGDTVTIQLQPAS